MEQVVGEFTRKLVFTPGFCWVREDPKRDFGNGAVVLTFVLIGAKGAVQWKIGTEWMPEAARKDVARRRLIHGIYLKGEERCQKPMGWDLGYHSPTPRYEGQTQMDHCDYVAEGKCYYDGSGLNADLLIEGFLNGGEAWVWPKLEDYYRSVFEDGPWPDFTPTINPHPDERLAVPRTSPKEDADA